MVVKPDVNIDSQVGVELRFAYQRAVAVLNDEIREFALTPMQVSVMARLQERGPTTQNRLGRSLGMDPPNVRDVVQRLAKRGLVVLEGVPEDRRAVLIKLSPAGTELFAAAWPRAEHANARILSRLSDEDRSVLTHLLGLLAADPDQR